MFGRRLKAYFFGHSAPLWRFYDSAPSINVMTYLLTYLLTYLHSCTAQLLSADDEAQFICVDPEKFKRRLHDHY